MGVLVTKEAPNFTAQAVLADGTIADLTLASYRGKSVVLYFYPLDFTFVCPTEIIAFDKKLDEFRKRNTEVIGVSVDSVYTHFAWRETPVEHGGIGRIGYPLVADLNKNIARAYDVLLNDEVALRGLFLIDTHGVVRHQVVNDLPLGRSVDEALRMVDALHFVEEHGEVCPANWQKGEEAMPATAAGVSGYLAKKYVKK
ncbi:MAG: redoxin domain-containing protein [Armatimonadota bacterium]